MPLDFSGPLEAIFSVQDRQRQQYSKDLTDQYQSLQNTYQGLQNDRYGQMTPLETTVKQLEAERAKAAMTPEMIDAYKGGYMGQMNSQIAAGKKALGTVDNDIKLANKKSIKDMEDLDFENLINSFDSELLSLHNSPDARATASEILSRHKITPQSGFGREMLQDPYSAITNMKQRLIEERMKSNQAFQEKKSIADSANQTHIDVARINEEARLAKAKADAEKEKTVKTLQEQYNRSVNEYRRNPTEETKRHVQEDWDALQTQLVSRTFGNPDVGQYGVQTNQPQAVAPALGTGQPQQTNQPDLKSAAEAAWGSYDPTSYDYRVGPNGKLQRKAK